MSRTLLYYAMPILLVIASLLQSTAANRLEVRGVKPDLVLLLVIIGALIYGSRAALVWAFAGGLVLDLFSGGPLGSSSLALMAAALVVGIGHNTLSRYNLLVPLAAGAVGTWVYGASYLGILSFLEALTRWQALAGIEFDLVQPDLALPLWSTLFWPTMQIIVIPALFYNTVLLILLTPLLNRIPEGVGFEA
jgi:rod shape-determining protein MreD